MKRHELFNQSMANLRRVLPKTNETAEKALMQLETVMDDYFKKLQTFYFGKPIEVNDMFTQFYIVIAPVLTVEKEKMYLAVAPELTVVSTEDEQIKRQMELDVLLHAPSFFASTHILNYVYENRESINRFMWDENRAKLLCGQIFGFGYADENDFRFLHRHATIVSKNFGGEENISDERRYFLSLRLFKSNGQSGHTDFPQDLKILPW